MIDRWLESLARIQHWWRQRALDRDLDEELRTHAAMAADEAAARGEAPARAARQARVALGSLDLARERYRDARGLPHLDSLARDVRDAARLLRRQPGFTAVAVLSLALGIGANAAIFSVFNALILRPLPVRDPAALVQVVFRPTPYLSAGSYPLWQAIQEHADFVDGVCAWSDITPPSGIHRIAGGVLERITLHWVSGDYFAVLGAPIARGRALTRDDEQAARNGGPVAAVASDAYWRRELGGSEAAIGRVVMLDAFPVVIVGVTAPAFDGPDVGHGFDLVVPITAMPQPVMLTARTFWWVSVFARMKAGQTIDGTTAALRHLQPSLREATLPVSLRPDLRDAYLRAPMSVESVQTGRSELRRRYQDPLVLLMAGVGLLLVIACANLTNLLLARGEARRHEIALRLALGASRGRLIRQFLIEALLLSIGGALAGAVLAAWVSRALISALSTDVDHIVLSSRLDWRTALFLAGCATLTALIVGALPAWRATRTALRAALADRSRSASSTRSRTASALVAVQIALSVVLVSGAGLLGRTFLTLAHVDLGFDPRAVISVHVAMQRGSTWGDGDARTTRLTRLRDRIAGLPGVAAAAFAGTNTPLSGYQSDNYFENPPGLSLSDADRDVYFEDAGRGWFDAMDMRLVAGRDFRDDDGAPGNPVVVVNETMARRFFPDGNAVGSTVREVATDATPPPARTIIGIVNDAAYINARQGAPPTMYTFMASAPELVVRAASGRGADIARQVERAIADADPEVLARTRLLGDQASATLVRERLLATLSLVIGGVALLLAGVGVYGVVSYTVGRRIAEIGVRRALGATTPAIARLVLRRTMALACTGAVAGGLACVWALRFLTPLLYALPSRDPLTIGLGASVLILVAVLASGVPLRRAMRVDPAIVLREQ